MRIGINGEHLTNDKILVQLQICHGEDEKLLTWGTTEFESEVDYTSLLQLICKLNEEVKEKEKVYV